MYFILLFVSVVVSGISITCSPEAKKRLKGSNGIKAADSNQNGEESDKHLLQTLPPNETNLSKTLLYLTNTRQKALERMLGCVKVGDLLHFPAIEKEIISFVTELLDFDDNVRRAATTHQQIVLSASRLVKDFCYARNELHTQAHEYCGHRLAPHIASLAQQGKIQQGETSSQRDKRSALISTFRDRKNRVCLAATEISLRFRLSSLDTFREIDDFSAKLRGTCNFANDPSLTLLDTDSFTDTKQLLDVVAGSATSGQVLESSGLPRNHPTSRSLKVDLEFLASTQAQINRIVGKFRQDLVDVDDIACEFAGLIQDWCLEDLDGDTTASLVALAEKLYSSIDIYLEAGNYVPPFCCPQLPLILSIDSLLRY